MPPEVVSPHARLQPNQKASVQGSDLGRLQHKSKLPSQAGRSSFCRRKSTLTGHNIRPYHKAPPRPARHEAPPHHTARPVTRLLCVSPSRRRRPKQPGRPAGAGADAPAINARGCAAGTVDTGLWLPWSGECPQPNPRACHRRSPLPVGHPVPALLLSAAASGRLVRPGLAARSPSLVASLGVGRSCGPEQARGGGTLQRPRLEAQRPPPTQREGPSALRTRSMATAPSPVVPIPALFP